MGLYDFIAGTDSKLAEAELLYSEGLYEEALEKIELDNVNSYLMSKENYIKTLFLSAKCWNELGDHDSAIRMLNLIIDDPEGNNKYMSRAEAFKKRIQSAREEE